MGKFETFLRMILNVNMIKWESSEERINENYYTETFKRLVWAFSNKDNARKKYFNFKWLSSDDIFAFLDSIKTMVKETLKI